MKNKKSNLNSLTDFMKDTRAYQDQSLITLQTKSFLTKNKEKILNWMKMMSDKYCVIFIPKVNKSKLYK